jgi:hypothetical protein
MSDMRQYAVEETGLVHLRDASGNLMYGDDKKPMTWTVYSPGSKQYAKVQAEKLNRYLDTVRRKGNQDETAEQRLRDQFEFVIGCTKECSSNIQYDNLAGEELYRAVLSTKDSASTSGKAPG